MVESQVMSPLFLWRRADRTLFLDNNKRIVTCYYVFCNDMANYYLIVALKKSTGMGTGLCYIFMGGLWS
jgi:hypothetical protein